MKVQNELGLVQVYTGNGKGKTTAALGQGFRAVGHGFRVHMIQFMKGRGYSGELIAVEKLTPLMTISQFGRICPIGTQIRQGTRKCNGCRSCFVKDTGGDDFDRDMAQQALEEAIRFLNKKSCDMLILDEIGNALRYNLVAVEKVLELIQNKPAHIELILTGRGVPNEIIEVADLVTEMKDIKHPFAKGISSRRGTEY